MPLNLSIQGVNMTDCELRSSLEPKYNRPSANLARHMMTSVTFATICYHWVNASLHFSNWTPTV